LGVHDYHVVAIRLSENWAVYDVLAHIFVHDVVALNIYVLRSTFYVPHSRSSSEIKVFQA